MENITFKQVINLMMTCNYKNCEVWNSSDYVWRTHGTKKFRKHRVASKIIEILVENGMPPGEAEIRTAVEVDCKLSKKNLDLLGKPLLAGSVDEISNHTEIYEEKVWKIKVTGLFRNKLIILLDSNNKQKNKECNPNDFYNYHSLVVGTPETGRGRNIGRIIQIVDMFRDYPGLCITYNEKELNEILNCIEEDDCDISGFKLIEVARDVLYFGNEERNQKFVMTNHNSSKWKFAYEKDGALYYADTIIEAIEKYEIEKE